MKYISLAVLSLAVILSACSSLPPVAQISLDKTTIQNQAIKIGIVSKQTPKISVVFPGAGCLLCVAVAIGAHSDLSTHVKTLESDVPDLDNMLFDKLKAQGLDVTLISEDFDLSDASKIDVNKEQLLAARRDFRPFAKQYGLTHIVFMSIGHHGVIRDYSGYIPTSAPYASVSGVAYMIDLSTNQYVWHNTINNKLNATGEWKTPPAYPELTNAYYSVVESTKESVLEAFDFEKVK